MNSFLISKLSSWVGLAFVLVPCLLALAGLISIDVVKWLALAGTVVWFVTGAMWIGREPKPADENH